MVIDRTTLEDLAIFSRNEQQSVLRHLDFTRSSAGREQLAKIMAKPLESIPLINARQQLLQHILRFVDQWPAQITNGTIMVLDKYFKSAVASIPYPANALNSLGYKLLNSSDYSTIRYTVSHFIEFVQGLDKIHGLLSSDHLPSELANTLQRIDTILHQPEIEPLLSYEKGKKHKPAFILTIGYYLQKRKQEIQSLLGIYGKIDAWYSLAMAVQKHHFCFPGFVENSDKPLFDARQLFHPLLTDPVAYDFALDSKQNFLFLTGANMAGKSTFIKAVGISVYLAHLGIGVPAQELRLSLFDGLLSNIQVTDNVLQGESYFFNEVQRIKQTVDKIKDKKHWLILIDELFKGTNVQDAMRCSKTVIEGLRKVDSSLFILSTHLYEIAEELTYHPNIQFRYFETNIRDNQLQFSYQLQQGVSNDRIGYLILQKEGVVDQLDRLA